jgi:tetratricopeptide (TPR) repeat protein
MYHSPYRPWRTVIILLSVFSLLCFGIYFALSLEPVSRRLAMVPYYAESYLKKLRPDPALPTPPAVSGVNASTLLQGYEADSQAEYTGSGSDTPAFMQDVLNTTGETRSQAGFGVAGAVQLVESSVVDQVVPIQPAVTLPGINHEWQTWNNCGPSTIAMNLSFYNDSDTQVEAAQFLKPNEKDKNVSPEELVAYALSKGFLGFVGVGGTPDLLKQFLSNGFPVIVEFWTERDDAGGMGHYRLLTGYDDTSNEFIAQDSLHGANIRVPIAGFNTDWQVFNRTFVLVFPPEQAPVAYTIAGPTAINPTMYRHALASAQAEAQRQPENPFAWFNIGTNYARLGETELAAGAFDEARRLGLPYRMLWYQFDIFDVYLAEERYQELIELTTAVLEATSGLEELYYYRGLAYQALGDREAARKDFQAALDYNPAFEPARAGL